MLRPTLLLPLRSLRRGRLLTPRCGRSPLGDYRLGSATRHSGTYLDGTFTRRFGEARACLLLTLFRTRHVLTLEVPDVFHSQDSGG